MHCRGEGHFARNRPIIAPVMRLFNLKPNWKEPPAIMDKKQISKILKEMAVMMEIIGSNPFKVRAHENAARILEGLTDSLSDLVASGEITKIKGIGKGTAEKITRLLNDEELDEYNELKASIPPGV
ncbi:MAG: hypothetical protein AAFP70_18995, partial [Calditrichota bacterium]